MRRSVRTGLAAAFAVVMGLFDVGAAAPEAAPVPAALSRVRDGLPRFFGKAENGGEVRVAYLGGSITAAPGWRVKSLALLKERFPKAKFTEIAASIGGTGSDLGVYRIEHDALQHRPDLLFVEFCVNDASASPARIWSGMEGIVRKTWKSLPDCDICFVYTFKTGFEKELSSGICTASQSAMEQLADHYGIPSVNFSVRCMEMLKAGRMIVREEDRAESTAKDAVVFSKDGVHPLDAAHGIYTEVLGEAFLSWAANRAPAKNRGEQLLQPFSAHHWEDATMVPFDAKGIVRTGKWQELPEQDAVRRVAGRKMMSLWTASEPGAQVRFRFRGTSVRMYDMVGPNGGQVDVEVDGKRRGPVARFDSYCTYHRLSTLSLAEDLPAGEHEVVLTLRGDQPDRSAVIAKDKPGTDPAKYVGTVVWFGGVLLRGEIVP
jgi:hypothetical protein